jgi:hypothetical protein
MRQFKHPVQVQRIVIGDLIDADQGPSEVTGKEQFAGANAPVRLIYTVKRTGERVSQVYVCGDEETGLLAASPLRQPLLRETA